MPAWPDPNELDFECTAEHHLAGLLLGRRLLAALSAPIAIPIELRRGALPTTPRIELRWHHDRWRLVHCYAHEDCVPVRSNGRRWCNATGDRHECPVDEVVAAAAAEQQARGDGTS